MNADQNNASENAKVIVKSFKDKFQIPWKENSNEEIRLLKGQLQESKMDGDREERRQSEKDLKEVYSEDGEWMKKILNPLPEAKKKDLQKACDLASEALLAAANHVYPRHPEGQQRHFFEVRVTKDGNLKFVTNDRNIDINWPKMRDAALQAIDGPIQSVQATRRNKSR